MLVQRSPRSDVRPSEVAAADVNVVRLFHHAEVDRNVAAFGVDAFDVLLFLRGIVVGPD